MTDRGDHPIHLCRHLVGMTCQHGMDPHGKDTLSSAKDLCHYLFQVLGHDLGLDRQPLQRIEPVEPRNALMPFDAGVRLLLVQDVDVVDQAELGEEIQQRRVGTTKLQVPDKHAWPRLAWRLRG